MDVLDLILVALAAVAGGAVNALAGGGTLITFPMLTTVGVPAMAANVTNTVALCPGYLGATLAQWNDLRGQARRAWLLLPAAALGGIAGGVLLLHTGERLFRALVPYLILLAAGLLAVQDRLRAWVARRARWSRSASAHETAGGASAAGEAVGASAAGAGTALLVAPAAVYGGYFGAGMSVIVLAALGLALDDTLTRLNALKQAVALSVNVAAAIFFLFSGRVVWIAALAMAVGALIGGALGGRLASRIRPATLRWIVVTLGVVIGLIYLSRR
ncbi:MAG: sulfite exporter TauE/SafE family protein [Candidatus Sumerlaeota bacterium]|nr:sulfite exporter TauE/SafE family protein [Candidatus Sumerlaeota bacterium]